MRFPTMVLALTGTLLMTGCSTLVSLNPFAAGQQARLDPAMAGVWHDPEGEDTYIVTEAGNAYAITVLDKSGSASKLEARLLEAGDAKILDLVSKNDDPFQIAAHTPVRVWIEGATLRFAFLDSAWLKQQAVQQLATQANGDRTLITAPSDAVRNFLTKYGADARAYGGSQVLQKVQ